MKYLLSYRDAALGEAWRRYFSGVPDVQIVSGDICRLSCDAIVSPANSFGFMDGGLDHQLSEHFGWDLEKRVQAAIQARPLGELLIGEAIIESTGNSVIPWLVVAPTMRVPMPIRTSINAYLAMKAILVAVRQHKNNVAINSVAIPGLGTGVGELSPELCASQMWEAFQHVVTGLREYPNSFVDAQNKHLFLNRSAMLYY